MTYGLWLSAGGLQVNEYRESLAANNLANVETVGFKRDLALIHQRQAESAADPFQHGYANPLMDGLTGGTWVRPTFTNFEQGRLEETGNPLDLAIEGDGFLPVSDGSQTRYTRDGRMTLNAKGELVMVAGDGRFRVLDEKGQPIRINTEAGPVDIGRDGAITQGPQHQKVAQLTASGFDDPTLLRKQGEGLYEYLGSGQPGQASGEFISGHVERSTVDPAAGLIDLIEVSRSYELNARMISLQDQTLDQAVNRVGRIG